MANPVEETELGRRLDWVYDSSGQSIESLERLNEYHRRHRTHSMSVVTVGDCDEAMEIMDWLAPQIEGKTVVEIGAGIGLLAWYMAQVAKKVIAVEVDPAWVSVFVDFLYEKKPRNLTWIFGDAEQVAKYLRSEVAVFCTYSAEDWFHETARVIAPIVIDVRRDFKTSKVARFETMLRGFSKCGQEDDSPCPISGPSTRTDPPRSD